MKKTNKKNSKMRKLLPAFAMLTVSAISLSSATYAWFTMNREVSVTNMLVQAKAEGGLLISETAGHTATDMWDDIATANNLPSGVVLLPTSSSNTLSWYHANSKSANDEAGAAASTLSENLSGSYTTLSGLAHADTTAQAGTNAANSIYYTNGDGSEGYSSSGDSAYYVKYTYYLKTSNEQGVTGLSLNNGAQCLSIKDVTVSGSNNSATLNKSLRVGVAIGGKFYIFAPLYTGVTTGEAPNQITDAPASYYVFDGNSGSKNIEIEALPANAVAYTDVASLNGITTDSPLQADIYLWYEGEDPNCKSENVTATLDTLTVGLKFELATNTSAKTLPTNNAMSTST